MKIVRCDMTVDKDANICAKLYDCYLYVRADFTVSSASQSYYRFVAENSILPFTDLIEEEDARVMKDAISDGCKDKVELYTRLYNRIDQGWRNVYVSLETSERKEAGQPLFLINVLDIMDARERMRHLEKKTQKYRFHMSIKDEYYFEYYFETNQYSFYKYVNGKSIMIFQGDYDEFTQASIERSADREAMRIQCNQLTGFLKSKSTSFELNWRRYLGDQKDYCYKLVGGVSIYNPEMITGVIIPQSGNDYMAYYLTAAGKDPFTGLLNKRATSEYSMDKLASANEESIMWMIVMDIDAFKSINDRFGHSFGDEVIKFVADTLQKHLGRYGVVGRFGGDEFFALLHEVPNVDELRLLLKVITKELMYQFDDRMKLTVSIGISQYPKDGKEFDILFGKADKSLYIAKEKGKNRFIIYDEKKHGVYSKDTVGYQKGAGLVPYEKRRNMLIRCISEMNANGIESFLANGNLCQGLIDLFDLGGITIYGDGGEKVLLRMGAYRHEPEDRSVIAKDPAYAGLYEHEMVLTLNSMQKLQTISEAAYQSAVKQEIGASIRCMVKKDGNPYVFVDYDILGEKRKWSDSDVEILSVLGCLIGEMIKKE